MGKILENGSSQSTPFHGEEQKGSIDLPIPLSLKEEVLDQLRGLNIAIHEGKIVAVSKSLKKLHETLEDLIPEGERVEIEYVERGASIYGINL